MDLGSGTWDQWSTPVGAVLVVPAVSKGVMWFGVSPGWLLVFVPVFLALPIAERSTACGAALSR